MTEHDFATASREALIALILEQHATIVGLQERISALEKRLAGRAGPGMPGNKPVRPKAGKPTKPRQTREEGFGRPRLPPTETVQHVLEACPDCRTTLRAGWVQATREGIEVLL